MGDSEDILQTKSGSRCDGRRVAVPRRRAGVEESFSVRFLGGGLLNSFLKMSQDVSLNDLKFPQVQACAMTHELNRVVADSTPWVSVCAHLNTLDESGLQEMQHPIGCYDPLCEDLRAAFCLIDQEKLWA